MKKISTTIFEPYLYEPNSIRPNLEKPFLYEGCIVASDSHVLIMISRDLLESEPELSERPPLLDRAIPEPNCELVLTGSQLSQAFEGGDWTDELETVRPEIKCSECDGDGEVEWEYVDRHNDSHTRFFDCPCCNGSGLFRKAVTRPTGRKRVSVGAAIEINGVNFWADQLQTLHDTMKSLEIEKVIITSLNAGGPCRFHINNGIEVVVMAASKVNEASSLYHLNLTPQSNDR